MVVTFMAINVKKGSGNYCFVSRQMQPILSVERYIYESPGDLEVKMNGVLSWSVVECSYCQCAMLLFFLFHSKGYDLQLMLHWTRESVDREVGHVTNCTLM